MVKLLLTTAQIHRDIKLTNIFIGVFSRFFNGYRLNARLPDGKGDVKVGDFGLATSSLAQVAPADLSNSAGLDPDVTQGLCVCLSARCIDLRASQMLALDFTLPRRSSLAPRGPAISPKPTCTL